MLGKKPNKIEHEIPLICTISFGEKQTYNLGNYESKSVDVHISVQYVRNKENPDELFEHIYKFVKDKQNLVRTKEGLIYTKEGLTDTE